MRRATTPLHKFTLPDDPSNYEKILITYKQNGSIVLEKTKDDLTFDGTTASVLLTQEETNLFDSRYVVQVQVRVLTTSDFAYTSQIFTFKVEEVLDGRIL